MDPRSMLSRFSEPIAKRYRLINANCEPHQHLDALYDCLDDALSDAIAWLSEHPLASQTAIGIEMRTRGGEWRTVRYPGSLDLPCMHEVQTREASLLCRRRGVSGASVVTITR